jgi:hypothetical protein
MVEVKERIKIYWPVLVVFLFTLSFVIYRLSQKDWDPAQIAELGTIYQDGDPEGTEGYDGQFAYYIAQNPAPNDVSSKLDVPAYRYQRILYPIIARILVFGKLEWIPWSLIFINILSHSVAMVLLCHYLDEKGYPPRYTLIYGLWVGLVIGVGTDLYEPLSFGLIVASLFYRDRSRMALGSAFMTLALLTKETALPFWIACVMTDIFAKRSLKDLVVSVIPGIIFSLWQIWLFSQFSAFGIVSGGAMATSFELIPYGGFFRILTGGSSVFLLFVVLFLPTIILPNLWGTIRSFKSLVNRDFAFQNWVLFLNTLFITFLPFSTFREPLGLVRVASGLITGFLFYAVYHGHKRQLNYTMFWMFMLALIIQG